jgi:hypothetical protein
MILVVEGISASGKTSWCNAHAPAHVVPEQGRIPDAPDPLMAPDAAAAFWVERNVERWQTALAVERRTGFAVCDTDPLKLHYIWTLHQIGAARACDWRLERDATRAAIAERRIGFADAYFVQPMEPDVARAHKQADPTRSRGNFELHLRLQPALLAWYRALASVAPERVHFAWPKALPTTQLGAPAMPRYDLARFDAMLAALEVAAAALRASGN